MTDLVERLRMRAKTLNGARPVGAGDGGTYTLGYYSAADARLDTEAATAIETLTREKAALAAERAGLLIQSMALDDAIRSEKEERNRRIAAEARANWNFDRCKDALARAEAVESALREALDLIRRNAGAARAFTEKHKDKSDAE